MAQDQAKLIGTDLTQGIALAELADGGKLVGRYATKRGGGSSQKHLGSHRIEG
jgi:hypothetical protein